MIEKRGLLRPSIFPHLLSFPVLIPIYRKRKILIQIVETLFTFERQLLTGLEILPFTRFLLSPNPLQVQDCVQLCSAAINDASLASDNPMHLFDCLLHCIQNSARPFLHRLRHSSF